MSTLTVVPPPPPSSRLTRLPAGSFLTSAAIPRAGTDTGVRHFVELRENAILALNAGKLPRALRCATGLVWITQESDSRDRVLHPGSTWRPATLGKITAMSDARVEMIS
jgi:hypothetical protein